MSSFRCVAVLVWGILVVANSLAAQDKGFEWPQFRGSGGLGVSSSKGLPTKWSGTENIVWKAELPPGTSSPVVHGSHIYLTSYSGYNVPGRPVGDQEKLVLHVHCLNRTDGKPVWTRDVKPKLPEQDRIRDSHVYASSTPAIDADRLYVFFGKSGVHAFTHTGEHLWSADVGSKLSDWGTANSPLLIADLVVVNASVESESIVALDRKTGKEVWRARGIVESWNTPIVHTPKDGRPEIVVAIAGKVIGIDPVGGKTIWSCKSDIGSYMVPGLVASDGVVYCIGGRTNGSLAIRGGGSGDVTATHRLWTGKRGSNVSSPILHDGYLYWMNDNNEIAYCAEAKTGTIVYEEKISRIGQVYSSPVLAEGKIYYVSRMGRTAVIAAKPAFELLAFNDFGTRSTFNSSPAIAGDRLFIRSNQYLYCIGSR
jgi:outer membrane protein assembly factor BamB